MNGIRGNSSGFTIVELLVAMVVGGMLAGSVTLIVAQHTHVAQRGRDVLAVNAYVENKIESLRSAGFLSLSDGTTNITSELPAELKAPRSGSLQVSAETSAIKQVDLSITYSDQGQPRTYSYTTYIGELGVGQY